MKSWDGDGRVIKFTGWSFKIRTTPEHAIFSVASGIRILTNDTQKAFKTMHDLYGEGKDYLLGLGFKLESHFRLYRKPEWALADIPVKDSDNFYLVDENGKIVIKKDESPKVGEFEVTDTEMAQTILDVTRNVGKLTKELTKKIVSAFE